MTTPTKLDNLHTFHPLSLHHITTTKIPTIIPLSGNVQSEFCPLSLPVTVPILNSLTAPLWVPETTVVV